MRIGGVLALAYFLAAPWMACAASGGEKDFDAIVKAIESHYGVKRTHVPLVGVANAVVKVTHPEGVSGFQLAVFEDLESARKDWPERDRFMDSLPGELHPIVRAHSREDIEATYIYAGPPGDATEVLLASFEKDEATVIHARVNLQTLFKCIEDPDHANKMLGAPDEK